MKDVGLYGEHIWRDGRDGKSITITEGEIDALSLSQAMDNKYLSPLPSGCTSAKKAIGKSIEWLSKYEYVVLMFDNDEAGRRAAKECDCLTT